MSSPNIAVVKGDMMSPFMILALCFYQLLAHALMRGERPGNHKVCDMDQCWRAGEGCSVGHLLTGDWRGVTVGVGD